APIPPPLPTWRSARRCSRWRPGGCNDVPTMRLRTPPAPPERRRQGRHPDRRDHNESKNRIGGARAGDYATVGNRFRRDGARGSAMATPSRTLLALTLSLTV